MHYFHYFHKIDQVIWNSERWGDIPMWRILVAALHQPDNIYKYEVAATWSGIAFLRVLLQHLGPFYFALEMMFVSSCWQRQKASLKFG